MAFPEIGISVSDLFSISEQGLYFSLMGISDSINGRLHGLWKRICS